MCRLRAAVTRAVSATARPGEVHVASNRWLHWPISPTVGQRSQSLDASLDVPPVGPGMVPDAVPK